MARRTITHQEGRILAAISAMPYGGLVHSRACQEAAYDYPGKGIELEHVADYLEALQAVLRGVADRAAANEQELHALRQQREAAKQWMGASFDRLPHQARRKKKKAARDCDLCDRGVPHRSCGN